MNRYLKNILLGGLFFNLSCFIVSAAVDPIVLSDKENNYEVKGNYVELLEDSSLTLSIHAILQHPEKFIFKKTGTNDYPTIKNVSSAYWLRFHLKNPDPKNKIWILENLDSHVDNFELYKLVKDSITGTKLIGYKIPFSSRDYKHKNFVFTLPQDSTEQIYYVRVFSDIHNPIAINIKSLNYFIYYALNEYYLLGLFYGIVLIMALYNLILFLFVRDSIYIYYCLYVLSALIVTLSEDTTGFQFLWPAFPFLNQVIFAIAPFLLSMSFIIYARHFLELPRVAPKFDTVLKFLMGFYLLYFLLDLVFFRSQSGVAGYVIPFILIYVKSVLLYFKGQKSSRFFVLGYSFTFLGVIFLILRMGGINFQESLLMLYSFNIGLVVEVIIFSFAMSDRINIIKTEKKQADITTKETQEKLIAQLKENERLKDELLVKLGDRVKERTIELEEKTLELDRANELLKKHNIELKDEIETVSKNRILNRSVSFEDFKKIYSDDESCLKFLSELKWPNDVYTCSKCRNTKYCEGREEYSRRCTRCSYDESPTFNTIFHKLKFPLIKAFYILFLTSNNTTITGQELSNLLDLRRQTCTEFKKKVELAFSEKKRGKNNTDGWSYIILNDKV